MDFTCVAARSTANLVCVTVIPKKHAIQAVVSIQPPGLRKPTAPLSSVDVSRKCARGISILVTMKQARNTYGRRSSPILILLGTGKGNGRCGSRWRQISYVHAMYCRPNTEGRTDTASASIISCNGPVHRCSLALVPPSSLRLAQQHTDRHYLDLLDPRLIHYTRTVPPCCHQSRPAIVLSGHLQGRSCPPTSNGIPHQNRIFVNM
ncbi:hypothetical protein B0J11DRAFT_106527 [Dendryphion nanum]|uniref:Uncharacterized protein n=1 Tax=Dendryphion nanum TaxID=256645 RepID=A0A9P9DDM3_9PLEO|nr:hypothetical protein B0J11DRAFT_106527 [Dendryphion nanum]